MTSPMAQRMAARNDHGMAVKIDDDDDEGGGSGIQTSNHNSSFYLLHDFGAFLGGSPKKAWYIYI
jgi:hypothetical protein